MQSIPRLIRTCEYIGLEKNLSANFKRASKESKGEEGKIEKERKIERERVE